MVIKMVEIFKGIPSFMQTNNEDKLNLFQKGDIDKNKWLDMIEFSELLSRQEIITSDNKAPSEFYHWISNFFEGNSELEHADKGTKNEFESYDINSDGAISKVMSIVRITSYYK